MLRAEVEHQDGREVLLEAEVSARGGRTRVLVNRQRLARNRDLLGALRVSVFSPDDLVLLKGGPSERRRFLDDVVVALHPAHDRVRRELDRVLRQRTTLLKQAGGRLSPEVELTLDVWDAKLVEAGETLGRLRADLVADLEPLVAKAYEDLAGTPAAVRLVYDPSWRRTGLAEALAASRTDDLRRAVSSVGPHRDDLDIELDGLPAGPTLPRGSSDRWRWRCAWPPISSSTDKVGDAPILLLDDVLSELDPDRATALLHHVPPGQVLITTAGPLPSAAHPDRVLHIRGGQVVEDRRP